MTIQIVVKTTVFMYCNSEAVQEFTFIKPEAGVRGRCRRRVVYRFSSQVVASVHIGSELHQELDQVHHVDPCCMVQSCLMELH